MKVSSLISQKFHPILFSTGMVQAILEGRKTMTRRVIQPQPCPEANRFIKFDAFSGSDFAARFGSESANAICDRKPKYSPGDILWVRETWFHVDSCKYCMCDDEPEDQNGCYLYRATHDADLILWRPSIHMPREAARLFLRVTDVRVERVQEISEEGAIREGIMFTDFGMNTNRGQMSVDGGITFHTIKPEQYPGFHAGGATHPDQCHASAKYAFAELWDKLDAARGYGWDENPWVWAVTFERIDKPEGWCA